MASAVVVRSDKGVAEGAAGLVRRHDVRHLVPVVHRGARLHREAAPRPAVPGRREGTSARTRQRAARRPRQLRRIRTKVVRADRDS